MEYDQLRLEEYLEGSAEALTLLRARSHSFLVSILTAKGASPAEAEDILADLWEDCDPSDKGKTSLLAKYKGRSPVRNWLASVAISRLFDLKRQQRMGITPSSQANEEARENERSSLSGSRAPVQEPSLTFLLQNCLDASFARCPPSVLLMLRLVHVHELTEPEVGRIWGWQESKVSHALSQALEDIQANTLQRMKQSDPGLELNWDDFVGLCETDRTDFL